MGPYLEGGGGGRGEGGEWYIDVPIHKYTKSLLINHSYTQSNSFSIVSSFSKV